MPALTAPTAAPVLITGASGFIAAHILEILLSKGYKVRGTVRNQKKADQIYAKHPQERKNGTLDMVIVEDIAQDRAFDEAVKGVSAIFHVASPFTFQIKDNKRDLLDPAIKGTVSILEAAAREPAVKRIIVTSSFAAVLDLGKGRDRQYTYTDKDWNPTTYDEAAKTDNPAFAYCASKKLAEKAAWDFVEQKKPAFDLVTLCPPMVFGPIAHHIDKLSDLNESVRQVWDLLNGSTADTPETGFPAFVDVRDVARAHVLALETSKAGGERYLLANGPYSWQEVLDLLRKTFPERASKIPTGTPGQKLPAHYQTDSSKVKKELGLEFTDKNKTFVDTAAQLLALEKEGK